MAEVRIAPIRLSRKLSQVRDRCAAASTRAPITPIAAASVAVAYPRYIDPMTTMMSAKTGSRTRELRSFSAKLMSVSTTGSQSLAIRLTTAT